MSIKEFVSTVSRLREPDGCPWDREQTHESLARFLLEETYEVLEVIHSGEKQKLREELGDLLLQIVLHAQIAKEAGDFNFEDIAAGINAKMIERHPHVFGDVQVADASEVVHLWEQRKSAKAKEKNKDASVLDSVAKAQPALMQALKISEKAVSEGFEWKKEEDLWDKLLSEVDELRHEIEVLKEKSKTAQAVDKTDLELELGDVLFCLVNVARWHKLNPEEALIKTIEKFKKRFACMEKISQKPLKELSKDDLYQLWIEAKAQTKLQGPR
ncbi:MAG: nucleoside triphosphate pyrophosphohydrolase [Candidatus Melainabacteria bacterium]|nr:nucleoside triphosphate pyrophosphohydrolase [Candidatus Melainabacteria bacterium]